jgi:hypothetical protein
MTMAPFPRTQRRANTVVHVGVLLIALALLPASVQAADRIVRIGDAQFMDKGLVAVGRLPANLRDKFDETCGSGSGMSVDRRSWRRTATGYQGNFVLLPDRGYSVEGTTDYRARLNTLAVELTPDSGHELLPPAR